MRFTQRRPRDGATTAVLDAIRGEDDLAPIGPGFDVCFDGFEVDAFELPTTPTGISDEARRQAAVIVLRLQRGDTPEQIVSEPSIDALRVFAEDELEREEALAHVAILAGVLSA